ncbi:hypothetical protein [Kribbella speibonae]|uniref:Uncharacterized protein n=1 Tax=Kribbella speibonae TaxID=1572660 RepID=A0ABY1ZYV1_9ACTN|nr:hypothetical protein [Kribbella speibonae]TCC19417.1 hypothetical protein E0H58_31415 [Kribbella speibonae]
MSDDQDPRVPDDGTVAAGDTAQIRLLELAALCHACRTGFQLTANRFHWSPVAGSAADDVAAALPSPDPLLQAPRVETGHRLVTGVLQTYLLTASGLLGNLSGLYLTGEVLFAPGMIVRGVIECSARVMWVLGGGDDEPEEILVRAYLEELLSAEQAKMAAGRLGGKSTDQYKARNQAYKDLKAEIIGRFPGTTSADLGAPLTLCGHHLAAPGEAVSWMYEMLEKHAGSAVTSKMSEGIYDFLSNLTHPTLYPTRDLWDWGSSPEHPDEQVAVLRTEIDFIERQATAAVTAYYNALSYVTSFFGWSMEIHDQLTDAIDQLLPNALHDPA